MGLRYDERKFLISLLLKNREIKKGYYYYTHEKKHYAEHRILMELILDRKLKRYEIVHHKDHNKLNNEFRNLEIQRDIDHASMHHAGSKREDQKSNPSNKIDDDMIKKIKKLSKTIVKKNGKPHFSKIAEKVGLSDFTVARYLKN